MSLLRCCRAFERPGLRPFESVDTPDGGFGMLLLGSRAIQSHDLIAAILAVKIYRKADGDPAGCSPRPPSCMHSQGSDFAEGKMRTGWALGMFLAIAMVSPCWAADKDHKLCNGEGGANDERIAACTRMIAHKGESKKNKQIAYFNRGIYWHGKGDNDNAIADYDHALNLDPENVDSYANRGNAWLNKGDYERAIADYDKAIELDPRSAYVILGGPKGTKTAPLRIAIRRSDSTRNLPALMLTAVMSGRTRATTTAPSPTFAGDRS